MSPATAVMPVSSPPTGRKFAMTSSKHRRKVLNEITKHIGRYGVPLTTLYLGISANVNDDGTVAMAMAIHDTTYLIDFSVRTIGPPTKTQTVDDLICDHVTNQVLRYEQEHFVKFIGAGLPIALQKKSPGLCSRLWLQLDIVPISMRTEQDLPGYRWEQRLIEEQADSMARKCILLFGPSLVPVLQVGFRGIVQTDCGFRAHLATKEDFKSTCGTSTWDAMMHYVKQLKAKKIKIAFFSSTPQGGGVALMRHALVRFARVLGVDLTWYVPKPRPGVFRITKNMHNILQGVSEPGQRISHKDQAAVTEWISRNAERCWLSPDGPLCSPKEGGADIVVIDDPQMPGLIPLIKKHTPNRPVIYRSHIQIRSDLIAKAGSPQAEVWDYLWNNIKQADMFISHPIPEFVPHNVPREKVAYMPATTDWLDGLNKPLNNWDTGYYGHLYNSACHAQNMTHISHPDYKYFIQIARFDPAKGIDHVIHSYAAFRKRCTERDVSKIPQLIVCGNGSVDDPDANTIYDKTMELIENSYPDLASSISVMRLDPNDQLLNTLMSNAVAVLQLSTREGFEVKVSEALHAGRPVIASTAGGIPIQVKDRVNGFLVDAGDTEAVADHLLQLSTDKAFWNRMSEAARTGVSDEVGTVGNALCWFYLATTLAQTGNNGVKGNERWINDMAREAAGQPYAKGENRLPRSFTKRSGKNAE
ncbi:Trehalose phosphorylase [Ceratocystis lukuohia]|uniref:Trehalose phosphorylase n=1 Tax=Ceratocystis lukuohia TaxID=2019550 RepID=A0ABR4MUN4_9PEZI